MFLFKLHEIQDRLDMKRNTESTPRESKGFQMTSYWYDLLGEKEVLNKLVTIIRMASSPPQATGVMSKVLKVPLCHFWS